jgi:hypothetical protein
MAAGAPAAWADRATRAANAVWANDSLYNTVLTDTAFQSPPAHSTDILFNFAESGLNGQRAVAESAPGDQDYNGGRWNVILVTFTPEGLLANDPDDNGTIDVEFTNAEEVLEAAQLGQVTLAEPGVYFECPLLPRRGGPR